MSRKRSIKKRPSLNKSSASYYEQAKYMIFFKKGVIQGLKNSKSYLFFHPFAYFPFIITGVGKSRFTVVKQINNTIVNKY